MPYQAFKRGSGALETNLSNLQQRLLVSGIGFPLAIAAVALSQTPVWSLIFASVIAILAAFALKEMYEMEIMKGLNPDPGISIFFSIGYLASLIYAPKLSELILLAYAIIIFLIYFQKDKEPIFNLSATFFGFLYITLPLSFLVRIAMINDPSQDGRIWLFYLLFVVKATDTAAFFFGKKFGKRPLAPVISPKKTWEGALCGFVFSLLISVLFSFIPHIFPGARFSLSIPESIAIGVLISILAQVGDLAESVLKRDANVKDSSSLPGVGGFLDILDSLVFAAPLVYIWIKMGALP